MARRRLTPTQGNQTVRPEPARAPIASVVRHASAEAALDTLAGEVSAARISGRLMIDLPLHSVDETHLVRDRIGIDASEMEALVASLRVRGQQNPIEVVDLGDDRYGLISGWRRLTALRSLHAEAADPRFATVLAVLRSPAADADAYVAMVEENEIRSGLGHYERARIAMRAAEQGAFPSPRRAVKTLFAAASRAKQSKIGAFLVICESLDQALGFPAELPERLGLTLSRRLGDDPSLAGRIRSALAAAPPTTARDEQVILSALMAVTDRQKATSERDAQPERSAMAEKKAAPEVAIEDDGDRLILTGRGVTAEFRKELARWLSSRK